MRDRNPKGRPYRCVPVIFMMLGSLLALPGVSAASPSCTVSPQQPTVNQGETVRWSAEVVDIRSRGRTYNWSFSEDTPNSSTDSNPEIRYDKVGTWTTLLKVADRRREAECTTTVTVAGTAIVPPTAAVCNPATDGLSINSTSQDGCPEQLVPESAKLLNGGYRVLAINDLGMHCGDLDTRISSILPPFQVLLAQVKG